MKIQEPKVEFVEIDLKDTIETSGAGYENCKNNNSGDDPIQCEEEDGMKLID